MIRDSFSETFANLGLGEESPNGSSPRSPQWPELDKAALYGLPGAIVQAIEPHSEADPVALLANLLCAFGNAAGRGAYLRVGADTHQPNLFATLVGETSKGRKGSSWGFVHDLMSAVDRGWCEDHIQNGLSSGEGLIYAVRDHATTEKDGAPVTTDTGVQDKRLLVMEGEFAGVLKMLAREGNTLSPVIRQSWDGGKLSSLTKNSPLKASHPHISMIAHVTKTELLRMLSETDTQSGFSNRFLWLMVRRSKALPFGGDWSEVDVAPIVKMLGTALAFARDAEEITWGQSARERWQEVYEELSEGGPGLYGAATSRAEAQAVRLAALYAVLDCSQTIKLEHLEAALALWRYAESSARYIFGDSTGNTVADKITAALEERPDGLTRTAIINLCGRNRSHNQIEQALTLLERLGRIRRESESTGGRPAERWFLK